ncbi:hypothetical protein CYMTET_47339 [Cymbomonas tetramitiformis]|uniref:AB hydrolase-1 domain-containing protein n=1 Tax=Cymbomonas tetramitiformis TaxID=36881 RepID=A0AAE0EWA1_9CHLO|nr:hypothetical protein CYMTET_47339 [Cymbomonas tetramitiformis]|eukprot:gene12134-14338_t
MLQSRAPQLHYDVHGTEGPHMLLIHGFMSSRSQWIPQLERWTPHFRIIVVELFGHGRSPALADSASYSPASYSQELHILRQHLGIDKWLVLGQSMGAGIAFHYALRHQQDLFGLAFTNSHTAFALPEDIESMTGDLSELATSFEGPDGYLAVERSRLNPSKGNPKWLPEKIRAAFEKDVKLHSPQALAFAVKNTIPESSVRSLIGPNFTLPVLLVVGEREVSFGKAKEFAIGVIPNLTVVTTDAGHAVNIGAAEQFNTSVEHFFAKIIRASKKL